MRVYSIRNWNEIYENNRSRQIKNMEWVPVPNRHDGEGYGMIMMRDDAAEIYAAWQLILQVASRCHPRGTLVRDDGTPLTPMSLAVKTRGRAEWFQKTLDFLSSPEVGWINCSESTTPHPGVTLASPSSDKVTIEGKGMEGNTTPSSPPARGTGEKDQEDMFGEGVGTKGQTRKQKREDWVKRGDRFIEYLRSTDDTDLMTEFLEWVKVRWRMKGVRKLANPEDAFKRQWAKIKALGPEAGVKCINFSLENGYQGLFADRFEGVVRPEASNRNSTIAGSNSEQANAIEKAISADR